MLRSPGRPLEGPPREETENRLGADFSDVRVHSDPLAQRSAVEIGARAYTSGSHVVVTVGGKDEHTLAHELTHVIQQRHGPVAGTDTGHEGFAFFFLEVEGCRFRETRFGGDGPARIQIPLTRSP